MPEVAAFLEKNETLEKIVFVCFGQQAYEIYRRTAAQVLGRDPAGDGKGEVRHGDR